VYFSLVCFFFSFLFSLFCLLFLSWLMQGYAVGGSWNYICFHTDFIYLLSTALQSQKKVSLLLAPLMISRNFTSVLSHLASIHAVSVIRSSPGPLLFAVWSITSPVQKILKCTLSAFWMTRRLSSFLPTHLTRTSMLAPSLVALSLMIIMCTTVLALHTYCQKRMSQPR